MTEGDPMRQTKLRASFLVMLALIAMSTSACTAEGYEQFSELLKQAMGAVAGLVLLVVAVLASIPPPM